MASDTLFLFTFIGVKIKELNSSPEEIEAGEIKPNDLRLDLVPVFMTQSFTDYQAAKAYGDANISMYLNPKSFHKCYCIVRDYVKLGSEDRAGTETTKIVTDNLTENLNPIVSQYLDQYWSNDHKRNFMFQRLNINPLDYRPDSIGRLTKYIADTLNKDCEDGLKQFHGKLKDDFLRNQIELRITEFLTNHLPAKPETVREQLSATT